MKKILLPVDSVDSVDVNPKTMEIAMEQAKKFDATLIILHVRVDINYAAGMRFNNMDFYPEMQSLGDKHAKEVVDKAKNAFGALGENVRTVILVGNPADEIIRYAEKEDIDLVIMGSNHMETKKRILMGSVTNKVVHNCKKPILIVQ